MNMWLGAGARCFSSWETVENNHVKYTHTCRESYGHLGSHKCHQCGRLKHD